MQLYGSVNLQNDGKRQSLKSQFVSLLLVLAWSANVMLRQFKSQTSLRLQVWLIQIVQRRIFATERGLDWHPTISDMWKINPPDGVIIATPNQMHVDNGLECVRGTGSRPLGHQRKSATIFAMSV